MKKASIILMFIFVLLLSSCQFFFDTNLKLEDYRLEEIETSNLSIPDNIDYASLINEISLDVMSANVTINNKTTLKSKYVTGSGVIFAYQEPYYYALTNEHVVSNDSKNAYYQVIDYKGNQYEGYLYENSDQFDYDLAIIVFEKDELDLRVMNLKSNNPKVDDEIIAIGQPDSQKNTITFGKVLRYDKASVKKGENDVKNYFFDALYHSANTNQGSSGGMILDLSLEVVGIHFASSKTDTEYFHGVAVPTETVQGYLALYIY